jgi:hypothetical protein
MALVAVVAPASHAFSQQSSPSATLRIVVVEGEDAVNVVQQRTAVAPVIEVRDRNDQPVAGAVVRFAIRNGRATFGGARTLTVTTNAAGRAVATGLAPTGSGAVQISATAAFQGQAATAVTIAQTNVMTAAQAAAAGGASGSSGAAGAGSGAGSTGGGISGTTIGVVGGAAVGGVVAAKELGVIGARKDNGYNGDFAGPLFFNAKLLTPCVQHDDYTGHLKMTIDEANGSITGAAHFEGTATHSPGTCNPSDPNFVVGTYNFGNGEAPVSGTRTNLTFSETQTSSYTNNVGGIGTTVFTATFHGSFDGTQIVGTLVLTLSQDDNNNTFSGSGTASYDITLR